MVGTDTTAPVEVVNVLLSPATVTMLPFEVMIVPAGTRTDWPLTIVTDCPAASVLDVTAVET